MEMEKVLLRHWTTVNENIPLADTPEGKLERIKVFKDIDVNNNGTLSINEIFIVLKDKLAIDHPHLKSSVFKAFDAVRILRKKSSKLNDGDHFITFAEFKRFLTYMKQYFEYYQMFDIIDSDNSKKIDVYEFEAALPFLKHWGLDVQNVQETFENIDDNTSGVITFDEFCYWAIKNSLHIPDEDE